MHYRCHCLASLCSSSQKFGVYLSSMPGPSKEDYSLAWDLHLHRGCTTAESEAITLVANYPFEDFMIEVRTDCHTIHLEFANWLSVFDKKNWECCPN